MAVKKVNVGDYVRIKRHGNKLTGKVVKIMPLGTVCFVKFPSGAVSSYYTSNVEVVQSG